ncbi:MAG: hypothetical protein KDB24_12015, partial [Microthrixaceae bacterium]|nr:hypothetical protein [Microthrixaceae bacterium]
SRLGTPDVAGTPGRPLRYLFLLVGGLVGALCGLLLTWFRAIREEGEAAAATEVIDITEPRTPEPNSGDRSNQRSGGERRPTPTR